MRGTVAMVISMCLLAGCGGDEEKADAPAKPKATQTADAPEKQLAACEPFEGGRLDVRAKFKPGEKRKLTITKRRSQDGRANESTSTATLEVLGPRRLRWTSDQVALPEGVALPEDLRKRLEQESEGIVLEYSVDAHGAFERLENVDEVRAGLERVMKLMTEAAGNDATARKALEQSRELVLSDAFIQASVTQDAAVVHGAYGLALERGKPLRTPYTLPNPFGGDPLPARANIEFAGSDPRGCAEVTLRVTPQPKAFNRAVEQGLAAAAGKSVDLPEGKLSNLAKFSYDAGSGWMTRVEGLKNIVIGDRARTDHVIVELAAS